MTILQIDLRAVTDVCTKKKYSVASVCLCVYVLRHHSFKNYFPPETHTYLDLDTDSDILGTDLYLPPNLLQ